MLRKIGPLSREAAIELAEYLKKGPSKEQSDFVEKCCNMTFIAENPEESID